MARHSEDKNGTGSERFAGFAYLLENTDESIIALKRVSLIAPIKNPTTRLIAGVTQNLYPEQYWPGDTLGDHLEFALKYDGVNLIALRHIFIHSSADEINAYIRAKPTGKYTRRIWFFYEFLLEKKLPIADVKTGNYVEALDPEHYFAIETGDRSKRHRVVNNLLGPLSFCPVVRREDKLAAEDELRERCAQVVADFPPELLRRALSFLYLTETKSSFAIENIELSSTRAERFASLLSLAKKEDYCRKDKLIELQNLIVDSRFKDDDYRTHQSYVGQTLDHNNEIIHYVCPKPDDVPLLMAGLIEAHERMRAGGVPAIVHAAVMAYGFVFIHPFEDGNGRIHRFLIHNILSLREFVPGEVMFPISAVMLSQPALYDQSLEAFSKPLLGVLDYKLDELGQMTVSGESGYFYQFMDLTPQAEHLLSFVEHTVDKDLGQQLDFLACYDKAKREIRTIVDMPDRKIDLFIKLCRQNKGRLSPKKKSAHFEFLKPEELAALERAVLEAYT